MLRAGGVIRTNDPAGPPDGPVMRFPSTATRRLPWPPHPSAERSSRRRRAVGLRVNLPRVWGDVHKSKRVREISGLKMNKMNGAPRDAPDTRLASLPSMGRAVELGEPLGEPSGTGRGEAAGSVRGASPHPATLSSLRSLSFAALPIEGREWIVAGSARVAAPPSPLRAVPLPRDARGRGTPTASSRRGRGGGLRCRRVASRWGRAWWFRHRTSACRRRGGWARCAAKAHRDGRPASAVAQHRRRAQ